MRVRLNSPSWRTAPPALRSKRCVCAAPRPSVRLFPCLPEAIRWRFITRSNGAICAACSKRSFRLAVSNPKASYDLGLGVIERGNNTPKLYEVPAQMWADITKVDGSCGVSILSDSKYGWDKPLDNCLRLTGIHTHNPPTAMKAARIRWILA